MICKKCKQAFNGSAGICHLCGTDHIEPVIPKAKKMVDIQIPEPAIEKETETPKHEKKKKGGK